MCEMSSASSTFAIFLSTGPWSLILRHFEIWINYFVNWDVKEPCELNAEMVLERL
jgi:hypothetical protein